MISITPSRGSIVASTWLILILFVVLLVTGWKYLIEPSIGDAFLATVVALFIAFSAFLAARHISQYRAQTILRNTGSPWHTGWPAYLLLACLSAIGTLNAAFVFFESRPIVRHDISLVRNSYDKLLAEGNHHLPPSGYAGKLNQIDAYLKSLHEEIVNPNKGSYCGVGIGAIAIIKKIAEVLPQYTIIRGSGQIKPCDDRAEQLYKSYEAMAHDMLKRDKQFAGERGTERLQFADELREHYGHWSSELTNLENRAAGFGGTASLQLDVLYAARRNFNSDRQRYIDLAVNANPNIPEIADLQSEQTGYAATFKLLLQRVREFNTWIYVAMSFGIDFALIFLLTQLYMQFVSDTGAAQDRAKYYPEKFSKDPLFIWVPPRHLSR